MSFNIISFFNRIEKSFSWSFLGFIVAIITTFPIAYGLFSGSDGAVYFEQKGQKSVFDVKESIPGIKVYLNNIDVFSGDKTLSIFYMSLVNNSSKNITVNSFDKKSPIGIQVNNGKFISYNIINADSQYLKNSVFLNIDNDKTITFNQFLFDSGANLEFYVLVLHDQSSVPKFSSIGKLSGVREIPFLEIENTEQKDPFLYQVFSGGLFIQVTRAISYFIIFIVSVVLFVLYIIFLNSSFSKLMKTYYYYLLLKNNKNYKIDPWIRELYFSKGINYIERIVIVLNDSGKTEKSKHEYESFISNNESKEKRKKLRVSVSYTGPADTFDEDYFGDYLLPFEIMELDKLGFLKVRENTFEVDSTKLKKLEDFSTKIRAERIFRF